MKTINKVLVLGGRNFLSLIVLTLTLVGLISTSIVTETALISYNAQATSNNSVDLFFETDFENIRNFHESEFLITSSLPIAQIFPTQSSHRSGILLSLDDSLTESSNPGSTFYIVSINLSTLSVSSFNESIGNIRDINSSEGVYITPQWIDKYNLILEENFSLYVKSSGSSVIQDSLTNISLSGELLIEDELQFMQLFGEGDNWERLGSSLGVIIMDLSYYDEKFRTESGDPLLTISSDYMINYIFDKSSIINKTPKKITKIFEEITQKLYTLSENNNFTFYSHESPYLDRIQYFEYDFNFFQIFLILGSFPIYLFGSWINKITIDFGLKKQLKSIRILLCKGGSRKSIKRIIVSKSLVIGATSWILAFFSSQLIAVIIQSSVFQFFNFNSRFFEFSRISNPYTLITLPIGIGISMLSTNSAVNTLFTKSKDILPVTDDVEDASRFHLKQSKKRMIVFWIISLLPLGLLVFPMIPSLDLDNDSLFSIFIFPILILLSLCSGFFFTVGALDYFSLKNKFIESWINQRSKSNNYSLSLRQIIRNFKKNTKIIFLLSVTLLIISQSFTFNSIVELQSFQTDLINNGNGLSLTYIGSNSSYTFYNQISEEIEQNEELKTVLKDSVAIFNPTYYMESRGLCLLDPTEWKEIINIPRNWISAKSDTIYAELSRNSTILVTEKYFNDYGYEFGETIEYTYINTGGYVQTKELEVIGYYSRFPLIPLTESEIPADFFFIASIFSFQNIKIENARWTFYPEDDSVDMYEFYKLIKTQIYCSDPTSALRIPNESGDYAMMEPDLPFIRYLQLESIFISIIIFFSLIILLKRKHDISEPVDKIYRLKGMKKKNITKIRIFEMLSMFGFVFIITIPSYFIGLNAIIGINQLLSSSRLPFRINIPFFLISITLMIFIIAVVLSYWVIIQNNLKKTNRGNSVGKIIT